MRLALAGFVMLTGAGACDATQLEALPLTVSVEASRTTVALRDSIHFVIKAGGGSLLALQADYGDGTSVESYGTGGARTASVTFGHVYQAAGTYTVTATATDAAAGQKTATVQIRVN